MKVLRISLAAAAAFAVGAPQAAQAVPATSSSVKLLMAKRAYAQPSNDSRVVRRVQPTTPIVGAPTVLSVIGRVTRGDTLWLRVRLPGRPNGTTGWMTADATIQRTTPWYVTVDLSARRAKVYRGGRVKRRFTVIVGKASTPTPPGRFFVTEISQSPIGDPLGPWVLALNGYSEVLRQFGGGPGQIALHGRGTLVAPLGSAASFGCVRFADGDITWLARRLDQGVPVRIRR